jgi:hypothetical protein
VSNASYTLGDVIRLSTIAKAVPYPGPNEYIITDDGLIGGYECQHLLYSGIVERPLWSHCTLLRRAGTRVMPLGATCPTCRTAWHVVKSPVLAEEWRDCPLCKKRAEDYVVELRVWYKRQETGSPAGHQTYCWKTEDQSEGRHTVKVADPYAAGWIRDQQCERDLKAHLDRELKEPARLIDCGGWANNPGSYSYTESPF